MPRSSSGAGGDVAVQVAERPREEPGPERARGRPGRARRRTGCEEPVHELLGVGARRPPSRSRLARPSAARSRRRGARAASLATTSTSPTTPKTTASPSALRRARRSPAPAFGFVSVTLPKPAPSAKLGSTSATLASVRSNACGSFRSARRPKPPSSATRRGHVPGELPDQVVVEAHAELLVDRRLRLRVVAEAGRVDRLARVLGEAARCGPRSRMPRPISPGRLMTGGASSPGAIGRSASVRSPSVRARKSTSTASLFALTVSPSVAQRGDPLDLARVGRAGVALQQRLDVRVDPRQRVVRQTAQALVEGVLVEVVVAVGALERCFSCASSLAKTTMSSFTAKTVSPSLVERRARRLARLLRAQSCRSGRRARPCPWPCRATTKRARVARDRRCARGPDDERVAEHRLDVVVEAEAAARLLELLAQVPLI